MRRSKQKSREPIWSPRPQKSWLRQFALEAEQQKCCNQITFIERRIAEANERATQQTTAAAGGNFTRQQALSKTLSEVADRERELTAYHKRLESLQGEIDALANLPAKDLAKREKLQSRLASLCVERFGKVADVEKKLEQLRAALREQAELTSKILETAAQLEFAPGTDFDAERFAALEKILPAGLLAQSHEWIEGFLGQEGAKEPCTVGSNGAVLPETLADAGCYRPGECVLLSAKRAKLLPSDDAPKPVPGPVEMELAAGNTLAPAREKSEEADSFPVAGFPAGVL